MKHPQQVDTEPTSAALDEPGGHLPAVMNPRHDATFERLFRQYYGPVWRLLHRMVGDEAAADFAQKTFLALYHHPPQPRMDEEAIRAWLFRVALNRGYNALRARRRRAAHLEEMAATGARPSSSRFRWERIDCNRSSGGCCWPYAPSRAGISSDTESEWTLAAINGQRTGRDGGLKPNRFADNPTGFRRTCPPMCYTL